MLTFFVGNFIDLIGSHKNGMDRKAYIKIRKCSNFMRIGHISLKSKQKINRDSANWQLAISSSN